MESDPPTQSSTELAEDPMPATSFARRSLSYISIEPAIFLGTLGYGLSSIISQVNLLRHKFCTFLSDCFNELPWYIPIYFLYLFLHFTYIVEPYLYIEFSFSESFN